MCIFLNLKKKGWGCRIRADPEKAMCPLQLWAQAWVKTRPTLGFWIGPARPILTCLYLKITSELVVMIVSKHPI